MKNTFTRKALMIAVIAQLSFFNGQFAKAQTITSIAGNGTGTFSGDGAAATAAAVNAPGCIVFDRSGNLIFSDVYNNRVRKITPSGIISTIAGNGAMSYSGDGGQATAASFGYPQGLALDTAGNLFICDNINNRIRKVSTAGIITTIAGTGLGGYTGDGVQATSTKIFTPAGIQVDAAGNIYFADYNNHRVRKIDPSGIISTIAGTGTAGYAGDGGAATAAQINTPYGLILDGAGNILFAEQQNFCIRKINSTGVISTYAGTGTSGFSGDGGPATAAQLNYADWFTIDRHGYLYVSDFANERIRMITPTGTISTYAGTGAPGFSGDGGAATAAQMYSPTGIALDNSYNLFFSDAENYRIRKITCGALPVAGNVAGIDSVCQGSSITLVDSTAGGIWVSANTAIATVSATGMVTGVAGGTDTIMYIVVNRCGEDTAFFPVRVKSYASCHLGITDVTTKLNMSVYPNPGKGDFTLTLFSARNENAVVVVTNILGEKVAFLHAATNREVELKLNVAPGIYFLTASTGIEQTALKLIID